ncbi:hypothetical protein [Tenacibaculum maritimum]|uniref:Uncharacterized protein n=1 Tax=Tenacibaculum maritimum NCIMB 2154 TaxID=1349785 RepID=A0A2H1E9U9_9FLAO|nr:hypothetical protein [Tenacibaculum maritimum]MCD9580483.1 hypothetical protein [Tenacibaculum maritimum]MCD9634913.1 hypothetical protein [Tenacibaculum maritimum]CAA0150380.1 hypothetical protein TMP248_10133 [Tenacibaculum maritimum]CAA0176647.1 hypothetical protein NCIMB2158_20020 [Tenacibaculum maritimum]CAA0181168.1 hypothetical protein USCSE301_20093 [Tenacibaculum maritimum]
MNLEQIRELKEMYLKTLVSSENNEYSEIKIKVDTSYVELVSLIGSLINVSQCAMEGMCNFEIPNCSEYDIVNTLEIAKKLLPHSEAQFLDGIKKL